MLSDADAIDDIFSEHTTSKRNQPLCKFQPKAKKKLEKRVSQPNENGVTINHHSLQAAIGSSENTLMIDGSASFENSELQSQQEKLRTKESIGIPVIDLQNNGSTDGISKHQTNESPVNFETRKTETKASAVPVEPENCFIRQAIDTFSQQDSQFSPGNNVDTRIPSNHNNSEPSSDFVVAEDFQYNVPVVDYMTSCFNGDAVPDNGLDVEISFRKNIASASLENDNFKNLSDTGIHKDVGQKAGEDRITSTRQLRKRNAVHVHDYDFEEESNEDSGPFTQEFDKDYVDDSDYTGEKIPKVKKVLKKSKSVSGESQKQGRKHKKLFDDACTKKKEPVKRQKKLSDDAHTKEKEPVKKHFSHSTRRKRRQVDKLLLETPEDEINERSLRIKDLILLAEAREKFSMKEASMAKQTNGNNSSGHIFGDRHFDGEPIFAEGQDRSLDDDEYGVNPEAKPSSTIFNHHSFMDNVRSPRWSKVDTELFYQAIRQFGTDFAMIQQLFPTRTRHQVKLKFKNEERRHPLQMADALTCRSKDNSQFEAVIQQLQAQATQSSSKDAIDEEEGSEWQDVGVENEKEEVGKSEQEDHGEDGLDHKKDQDANRPEHSPSDAELDEYQNVFDYGELKSDDAYK